MGDILENFNKNITEFEHLNKRMKQLLTQQGHFMVDIFTRVKISENLSNEEQKVEMERFQKYKKIIMSKFRQYEKNNEARRERKVEMITVGGYIANATKNMKKRKNEVQLQSSTKKLKKTEFKVKNKNSKSTEKILQKTDDVVQINMDDDKSRDDNTKVNGRQQIVTNMDRNNGSDEIVDETDDSRKEQMVIEAMEENIKEEGKKRFVCSCGKILAARRTAKRHIKEQHLFQKSFKCIECGKSFDSKGCKLKHKCTKK